MPRITTVSTAAAGSAASKESNINARGWANVLGVVVNGVVTPSYRAAPVRTPAVAAGQLAGAGLPA